MTTYYITDKHISEFGPMKATTLSFEALKLAPPLDGEIFYIDGQDQDNLIHVCEAIRQHHCPSVYLRPVVAVECDGPLPRHLAQVIDGEIAHGNLNELAVQGVKDIAQPINKAIATLPDRRDGKDSNLAIKMLRYLYSRQRELVPFRSSQTIYGLHFPGLEIFLRQQDASVFNLLDLLEDQKLLFGTFFEKVHQCNQCHSTYLNFQEVCPHCESNNLQTDELIHHFSCAHMAPEADFLADGKLSCPKCNKELRHLGADYDKPSAVYQCNSCRHSTQDPQVATVCFNCGAQSLPENLISKTIQSYVLTALGENAAINGLDNLFKNILERQIAILPVQTFKTILRVEIERIKRYQLSTSSLIVFQIGNMEEIMLQLGHRTKDLFGEMSSIIKAVLRTSDLSTSLNESTFMSLMPETPLAGASTALQRLDEKMNSLFNTNLQMNVSVVYQNSTQLTEHDTVDGCIDRLLRHASTQ